MNNSLILKYKGICTYDIYSDDQYLKSVTIDNMLVNEGQLGILRALSDPINYNINRLYIGSSVTTITTNSTLSSFTNLFSKEIDHQNYVKPSIPIDGKFLLQIKWKIETSEFNNMTVSELGIGYKDENNNDKLFAKVNVNSNEQFLKTSKYVIYGTWNISIQELT